MSFVLGQLSSDISSPPFSSFCYLILILLRLYTIIIIVISWMHFPIFCLLLYIRTFLYFTFILFRHFFSFSFISLAFYFCPLLFTFFSFFTLLYLTIFFLSAIIFHYCKTCDSSFHQPSVKSNVRFFYHIQRFTSIGLSIPSFLSLWWKWVCIENCVCDIRQNNENTTFLPRYKLAKLNQTKKGKQLKEMTKDRKVWKSLTVKNSTSKQN